MSRRLTSANNPEKHDEGTTAINVFVHIVPIVFTVIFTLLLNLHSPWKNKFWKFCTEFIVLVYTVVFHVTIFSTYIAELALFWALLALTLVLLNFSKWAIKRDIEHDTPELEGYLWGFKDTLRRLRSKASIVEVSAKHPGYVTMLRSTILLITVVCILAVDFKIFPGYSHKTHKYGFSLMDVGIGLFVCSLAMVSNKPPTNHFHSAKNLFLLVVHICPFIVLGVGRAVIIKQIDYNQAVTEYGQHWNAFLTLGLTKLFAMLFASAAPGLKELAVLVLVVLGLHEAILQYSMAEFVMDPNTARDTFFTANREGIVSIPGFVALYLATMVLGHIMRSNEERITLRTLFRKVAAFAIMSMILWPVVYCLDSWYGVSRRICNMGYVVWTICILTTMTALYMLVEAFAAIMAQYKSKAHNWTYIPFIMQSINYNGLFFFLMANILTGIVNMSIKTETTNTLHSLAILMAYMLLNCTIVALFYLRKWRIKFW